MTNMDLDRQRVEQAWAAVIAGRAADPNSVRSYIHESWRRCHERGMDPYSNRAAHVGDDTKLEAVLRENAALLRATRHAWNLLADTLASSECILVLVSREGIELAVFGPPELVDNALRKGVGVGYDWSEASAGTNAVATTLAMNQPTIVRSVEHYCVAAKIWDCAAAPIRDLNDGTLLGLLDVTSIGGLSDHHTLALAIAAAQQIEHSLHSLQLAHSVQLLDWYRNLPAEWRTQPALLVDRRGGVVTATERLRALTETLPSALAMDSGRPRLAEDCGLLVQDWIPYPDHAPEEPASGIPAPEPWEGGVVVLGRSRRFVPRNGLATPAHADHDELSPPFRALVEANPGLLETVRRADRMARTSAPVLLTGETGSGKEVFARALHAASAFAAGPFVALNCGTLTKELAASELLGYEAGAFTGASARGRRGKFEEAHGGTLFLDEIGDLSVDIQVQLLRVLQERVVVRIGGNQERSVEVRVIAATNRDLERDVGAGTFRLDLFYRLKVLSLKLPPLRERPGDIVLLVHTFLREMQDLYGLGSKTVAGELMHAMVSHPWPGNVRELRGIVESMYILSRQPVLTLADLPEDFGHGGERSAPGQRADTTVRTLAQREHDAIIEALARHGHNIVEAARELGISRSTLYRKLKEFGVDAPRG